MQQNGTPPDTASGVAATTVNIRAALEEAWAKATGWLEGLVESLPNILAALVLLMIFWGLSRAARKLVEKIAARFADQTEITRLIARAAQLAVLVAGLILALGVLNLDRTVTSLLAGFGIVGLALGFAFQDIAENFIAGIILNVRTQFREGDIVESGDFVGVIERVQLRATVMRTFTGQRVLIPNAEVFKNPIVNFTQPHMRRVDIEVGIAYDDDLEKAKRVAIEAVRPIEARIETRPVELFYREFGDSSINFQLRFWIPFSSVETDFLGARSEAIMRIRKAFAENDITIPFPIRTIEMAG